MAKKMSLYNKYRPEKLDDIVGQDIPVETIRNALESGNIQGSYLMTGVRGLGKTSLARIFAKALLCRNRTEQQAKPCDSCSACLDFNDGTNIDYREIDAGTSGSAAEIRDIITWASLPPQISSKRVVVIDEAHLLSQAAISALLKTLEEPPDSAVFILCTTEDGKIPATIRSRVVWLRFKEITEDAIAGRLAYICSSEGIECDSEGMVLIARYGNGSMRDAISALESVIRASGTATADAVASVLPMSRDSKVEAVLASLAAKDISAALSIASSDDPAQSLDAALRETDTALGFAVALSCASNEPRELVNAHFQGVSRKHIETISDRWSLNDIIHARSAIESNMWRVTDSRFVAKHAFSDILLMCIDPSLDPKCTAFGKASMARREPSVAPMEDAEQQKIDDMKVIDEKFESLSNGIADLKKIGKVIVDVSKAILSSLEK